MPVPASKCHALSSGLATSLRMIATFNFMLTSVITLTVGVTDLCCTYLNCVVLLGMHALLVHHHVCLLESRYLLYS